MDVTLFTFNSQPGFNFSLTIFPKVGKEKKLKLCILGFLKWLVTKIKENKVFHLLWSLIVIQKCEKENNELKTNKQMVLATSLPWKGGNALATK